jgi:hypothetical protein
VPSLWHLDPRAEPEPEQEVRRQQRDMMTGGTIDLVTRSPGLRSSIRARYRGGPKSANEGIAAHFSWRYRNPVKGRASPVGFSAISSFEIPLRPRPSASILRLHRPCQPSQPALRRPSTIWAWSSGRIHGTRLWTLVSNEAGKTVTAFSNASFASSIRPSCPNAAASHR